MTLCKLFLLTACLVPVIAQAAPTSLSVIDSGGATRQIPAEGTLAAPTPHSVPEVNGNATSSGNPLPSAQFDVLATGQVLVLTSAGTLLSIPLGKGQASVAFEIDGLSASGGAVVTPRFSNDGGLHWYNLSAISGGALVSTIAADGAFRVDGSGHTNVGLLVTTAGTGNATVSANASVAPSIVTDPSTIATASATRPNDTANNRTQTHDDQLAAIATSVAPRSGAWTDASYTATSAASIPAALAAVAFRTGIDIENLNTPGGATACMNWTTTAAVSGSGCAVGSIPIYAGGARTWDQPGNVSPEAISLICAGSLCPLTIKVR